MSSCWPPPPKTSESWRSSFRSRRPSSPHEAKSQESASLTSPQIPSAGARTEGSSTKSTWSGHSESRCVWEVVELRDRTEGLAGGGRSNRGSSPTMFVFGTPMTPRLMANVSRLSWGGGLRTPGQPSIMCFVVHALRKPLCREWNGRAGGVLVRGAHREPCLAHAIQNHRKFMSSPTTPTDLGLNIQNRWERRDS